MLSLFKLSTKPNQPLLPPLLPYLDEAMYPLAWNGQPFNTPTEWLMFLINSIDLQNASELKRSEVAQAFSQQLQENEVYQEWINFTVFGRYVQRSFSAFYRQSEDVFNAELPELLRHELMRHTQRLPQGQVLFLGGQMPLSVRQEKLIMTTLSPIHAIQTALTRGGNASHKRSRKASAQQVIINQITTVSENVKAFAVKHNKRTSDAKRHEVMILDFNQLKLMNEVQHPHPTQSNITYMIRYYNIG